MTAAAPQMLVLTLPDGATRHVPYGTLPREVVGSIGPRLLLAAIAVAVDGEIQDLMTPLRKGGAFQVLTDKDPRALAVLRHSGAHILATAVRRLRPEAAIGFGPAIDDGFYYDFQVAKPFTPEALIDTVRRVAGSDAEAEYADARAGELLRSVLDISQTERELGWRPQTTLEEGLRLTWG